MNEKPKIVLKGTHAIWLFLILTVGTVAIYNLAVNVGYSIWRDPYGVSPLLVAIAFICSVAICGIYILGNGMRYLAELLLEIRNEPACKNEPGEVDDSVK